MANQIDNDMTAFGRQCSDAQLEHNLKREWDAHRHRDYPSLLIAASERGWTVRKGERIA